MFWKVLQLSILMSTLLSHCCAVKWVQHVCDYLINITINSGSCILIDQLGFPGHLIYKFGFFMWHVHYGHIIWCIFACQLLGHGSTFDFGRS
jgi:hypothetical protein